MTWWTAVAGLTPIAVYDAKNVSGAQLLDRIGSNHITATASLSSTAVTDIVSVAGNSAVMSCGSAIAIPTNCTVAAFVRDQGNTVTFYDTSSGGYLFSCDGSGGRYIASSNTLFHLLGSQSIIDQFYFIALVKTGNSSSVYINGTQLGTAVSDRTPPYIDRIGYPPSASYNFTASEYISALGFWSGSASQADVQSLEAACRSAMTQYVVDLVGTSSTASAGILAASGEARTQVTGAGATTSAGSLTAGVSVASAVTGVSTTSSLGAITASGSASSTLQGAGVTASAGTPSIGAGAEVVLVGAQVQGVPGVLLAPPAAMVDLVGAATTVEAGAITAHGDGCVGLLGAVSTSAAGHVSASAGAACPVVGVEAASSAGGISATGTARVQLIGSNANYGAGVLAASGFARAVLTGTFASATAGTSGRFDTPSHRTARIAPDVPRTVRVDPENRTVRVAREHRVCTVYAESRVFFSQG